MPAAARLHTTTVVARVYVVTDWNLSCQCHGRASSCSTCRRVRSSMRRGCGACRSILLLYIYVVFSARFISGVQYDIAGAAARAVRRTQCDARGACSRGKYGMCLRAPGAPVSPDPNAAAGRRALRRRIMAHATQVHRLLVIDACDSPSCARWGRLQRTARRCQTRLGRMLAWPRHGEQGRPAQTSSRIWTWRASRGGCLRWRRWSR